MIHITEIKYEIDPIESNYDRQLRNWREQKLTAWFGLSEMSSKPSVFFEDGQRQFAISLDDLKTLLSLPAAKQIDVDLSKMTEG